MPTWLVEDPTPVYMLLGTLAVALAAGFWIKRRRAYVLGCGLVLLTLGVFFLKSGRALILVAMAGVALLMGLAIVIDRVVVTDREQVANIIYDCAAAAERNDLDAVLAHV